MAHIGKIACHHPSVDPNPNHDVYGITYAPPGAQSQSDLVNIDKVIYLSPADIVAIQNLSSDAERLAYIQDSSRRVWELIAKTLVAGTQSVAIQYIPTTNISVSDIGIFTVSNDDSPAKIKIFHESGLCVAAIDGDARTFNQELYSLTGTKRDSSIQSTLLYAGQKYFVVYYVWGVYPAYYQNGESQSIGNKIYENNTAASQTTIYDISENAQVLKPSMFRGVLNNSEGIFGFSENSWFVWMGSTQTGMTQGQIYRRTDVGGGWTFSGIVGNPSAYHTITSDDLTAILSKPPHGDFIWYVDGVSGMNRGEIWGKPNTWVTPTLVDISGSNDGRKQLALILMSLTSSTSKVMIKDGSLYSTTYVGNTMSLQSGYTSKVSSTTPLTSLPSNPNKGDIYYLSGSIGQVVGHNDGIFAWNGSSYDVVTQYNGEHLTTYFNIDELSSVLEYIGKNSDLLEAVSNTKGDETFLNANTDNRKYYLKINGNEV